MNFHNILLKLILLIATGILFCNSSYADEEFIIAGKDDNSPPPLIGETFKLIYEGNKSFIEIEKKYGLGYLEIREANPGLYKDLFFSTKEILIPSARIVPFVMKEGILINLAELRLYFFEPFEENTFKVRTFPIGIGRSGFETPTGNFHVTRKIENPTWHPPKTSRKNHPNLPMAVPPGPGNPLGKYWIQLSLGGYGIHGTNKESSIGKRVSLGCIRLFDENIEWLFNKAYRGMSVKIVNMPVKFGYFKGKLYMEVHKNGLSDEEIRKEVRKNASIKDIANIDYSLIDKIINEGLGVPIALSKEPNGDDSLLTVESHLDTKQ